MVKTKPYEANYEMNLLKGEGLRQDGLEGKKMSQGRYDVIIMFSASTHGSCWAFTDVIFNI